MTHRSPTERGRSTARPTTRDAARPTPHKEIMRAVPPRGAPELSAERASQTVRPRGGPPRPRGVR